MDSPISDLIHRFLANLVTEGLHDLKELLLLNQPVSILVCLLHELVPDRVIPRFVGLLAAQAERILQVLLGDAILLALQEVERYLQVSL